MNTIKITARLAFNISRHRFYAPNMNPEKIQLKIETLHYHFRADSDNVGRSEFLCSRQEQFGIRSVSVYSAESFSLDAGGDSGSDHYDVAESSGGERPNSGDA